LERLLAVVFVVIGLVNFAMKQQQKQNQGRGQGGMKEKQRGNGYYPNQTRRIAQEYMPSPVMMEESEGTEEEDRSTQGSMIYAEDRNIQGSMVYVEPSQSNEGVGLELPKKESRKKKEKKPAPMVEVKEMEEEDAIFEITEDNLLTSIIMAEVMGPPRSMKRSIR
jgi:flagellar motor protein MotB